MANKYYHILCKTNGYIPQLRMAGPVVHPLKVEENTVVKMIMSGLNVLEYDITTGKTLPLTLENVKSENRWGTNPVAEANAVSAPVEVKEATGVQKPVDELPLNEDGTVDESQIDFSKMSNSQKKKIKAKIAAINEAATKTEKEEEVEETPEEAK